MADNNWPMTATEARAREGVKAPLPSVESAADIGQYLLWVIADDMRAIRNLLERQERREQDRERDARMAKLTAVSRRPPAPEAAPPAPQDGSPRPEGPSPSAQGAGE